MEVVRIPKKTITVIPSKNSRLVDKQQYEQLRVAAYCRVSTDSDEQYTSYKNQMTAYKEMISKNKEWSFCGIYADEGISGTRADKRPEFKRLIKDCLNGKIDLVITKSVSRFARNTVECIDYIEMLKARGIGIIFEAQNINTLQTTDNTIMGLFAVIAQSESESISKNITWSYRKNFSEGKFYFPYSVILGYKKGKDGKPEIVPEEAKVIEEIYKMYLAGQTQASIADEMESRHLKFNDKEFHFSAQRVRYILTNEKYCGDAILQKSVTLSCISKQRKHNTGEAPMYYVHNNHPAIIDHDTYDRVQLEMARRRVIEPQNKAASITNSGKYSKYALTEVLKCAECGSRYRRVSWTVKGEKKHVWRCTNRLENGKTYCHHSPTLEEESLHKAIARAVRRFSESDDQTYRTLMRATIGEAIGLNGGSDEQDFLERSIDGLNQKMMIMVNETLKSGKSVEDNEAEFKSISDEIAKLKERIEAIQKTKHGDDYKRRLSILQDAMDERMEGNDEYDDSIVRQMVECIKVYENRKIEIIFGGGYVIEEQVDP